jgi:hypothetical protein
MRREWSCEECWLSFVLEPQFLHDPLLVRDLLHREVTVIVAAQIERLLVERAIVLIKDGSSMPFLNASCRILTIFGSMPRGPAMP